MTLTADDIVARLGLSPHPEGGHYRETWVAEGQGRPEGTCIYFLLKGSEDNHWHKIDATEIWHFYAGSPLVLSISETDEGPAQDLVLGPDLTAAERPQLIVPPGYWQKAHSTGAYTLVGCTVSPGFQFEHFELAPPGFDVTRT